MSFGLDGGGLWLGELTAVHGLSQEVELAIRLIDPSITPLAIVDLGQDDSGRIPAGLHRAIGNLYRSLLVVPIESTSAAIGKIALLSQTARDWDDRDISFVDTAGRMISIAMSTHHGSTSGGQYNRAQQQATLNEVARSLSSTLELEPLLQNILQAAVEILQCEAGSLLLMDESSGELIFKVSIGPVAQDLLGVRIPPGVGVVGKAIDRRQPIIVNDVQHSKEWFRDTDQRTGFVTRALIVVPMQVKDKVIGVIEVINKRDRQNFSEIDTDLLVSLASQAAIALENARLFEILQARIRDLSAISEASALLRDAENLKEMGPSLAGQVARLVNADIALVYLFDQERQNLIPIGAEGVTLPELDLAWGIDGSFMGRAIRTGSLHFLSSKDSTPLAIRQQLPDDLRPAMCIPIRTTRGQVVGAFLVAKRKSPDGQEQDFRLEEQSMLKTLAEIAGNALLRARSHEELEAAYLETVLALANAMDARDTYTNDHSKRLSILAEATAREMGCSPEELQIVRWGALLHDIGKIGVPDHILSKPGPLTNTEWEMMKKHPEIGAQIVAPINSLKEVLPIIQAHQEKYDGSGYPKGLKGQGIPLPARILAVVDAYSAITDERIYRRARSHEQALEELVVCSGSHFDPMVVKAFLSVIEGKEFETIRGKGKRAPATQG